MLEHGGGEGIWACKTTHFWTRTRAGARLVRETGADVLWGLLWFWSVRKLAYARRQSTESQVDKSRVRRSLASTSMQRDLLKARLGKLPDLPPHEHEDAEEEEDEERDSFPCSSARLPPPRRFVPFSPQPLARSLHISTRTTAGTQRDYSPLTAEGCFSSALEVDVLVPTSGCSTPPTATFRVYYTPPSPHASPTSPIPSRTAPDPLSGAPATAPWLAPSPNARRSGHRGVVFVCVHGAGYSGLSFACFAKEVVARGEGQVGVLAYDARGHGELVLGRMREGKG